MRVGNAQFKIGFWHPFGPHAGENADEIIVRKQREIRRIGWTLWSFQHRKTLELWYHEIQKKKPGRVLVFCSEGKGSRDPIGERKNCNYFLPVGKKKAQRIPFPISVPHPMGRKTQGSAFIVKRVMYPVHFKTATIQWLKDGKWQSKQLPTRPEYLIKPGHGKPMRKFRAVLELRPPYLAEVRIRP
ncbi:MAG: hypothetical protein WCV85_02255 [Patescibacteria group bacterium]|jgi:hypothetical protein